MDALRSDLLPAFGEGTDGYPHNEEFCLKNKLFSLDAALTELCVSLFDWAVYRQTKGAVKLHLVLDHEGYFPVFAQITDGRTHEVKIAQSLSFPKGSIVVMDRGYVDYALFARWKEEGVSRQKDNANYTIIEEKPVPANRAILNDQLIVLNVYYSKEDYPYPLRRIEVWDATKQESI